MIQQMPRIQGSQTLANGFDWCANQIRRQLDIFFNRQARMQAVLMSWVERWLGISRCPDQSLVMPASMRSRRDFPEPLPPRISSSSPSASWKVRPLKRVRPPLWQVRWRASRNTSCSPTRHLCRSSFLARFVPGEAKPCTPRPRNHQKYRYCPMHPPRLRQGVRSRSPSRESPT